MRNLLCFLLAVASLLAAAGCKPKSAVGGPAGGGAMPPIQVVAVEARSQPVTESLSLVGSIAPNEMVELKAETEGIVQEILFNEGQRVAKGDLLLRLDDTKLAATTNRSEEK